MSAVWMLRGISKEEAKGWMMSVKQTTPEPVFNMLVEMSNTWLPERFRKEVHQYVLSKGITTASSPLPGEASFN
jgi:hypothetical protein